MFLSDDDMVECPYNKTHRMLRKRLQSHLLKCRLSYPNVELRKCPFNITHLIPEPEYTHHATNCPDRKLITQYKNDAPEQKEDEGPKHAPIECDEDWDDTDVNDYNPRLYLDNANIIRKPDGANRSERKLFIKKERKRLGDGGDSSDEESKNNVSSSSSKRERNSNSESMEAELYHKHYGRSEDNQFRRSFPSSSSYSKDRSRSPTNEYNRNRSRSPVGSKNSYKNYSRDHSFRSKNVTNNQFNSGRELNYFRGNGRNVNNNQFNNGRDRYQSNDNTNVYYNHNEVNETNNDSTSPYYNHNIETNSSMPQAPRPPMISYPSPRSYTLIKHQPPPASHR